MLHVSRAEWALSAAVLLLLVILSTLAHAAAACLVAVRGALEPAIEWARDEESRFRSILEDEENRAGR